MSDHGIPENLLAAAAAEPLATLVVALAHAGTLTSYVRHPRAGALVALARSLLTQAQEALDFAEVGAPEQRLVRPVLRALDALPDPHANDDGAEAYGAA